MLAPPCWTDPIETARGYAGPLLARGLDVRPILSAFEDGEPTLLVRAGPGWGDRDRQVLTGELITIVPATQVAQLLVVSDGRTTDDRVEDPQVRDAVAQRCVLVETAERTASGEVASVAHLLPYHVADDGRPRFDEPFALPDGGPWAPALRFALDRDRHAEQPMRPAEMAYALSRRGVAVVLAPGWRQRYGFDAALTPRMVRPVDRERARRRTGGRRPSRPAERAS